MELTAVEHDERMELLKEPIIHEFDGNEKQFEEYVKECLPEIFETVGLSKIKHIKQQHYLRVSGFQIKIDLFVLHEDNSLSVVEVKCPNKKHPATAPTEQCKAIGQLLLYQSIVGATYGKTPRLFLIDNKIHIRTLYAFNENKLPISLIEIQKDRVFIPYSNLSLVH